MSLKWFNACKATATATAAAATTITTTMAKSTTKIFEIKIIA